MTPLPYSRPSSELSFYLFSHLCVCVLEFLCFGAFMHLYVVPTSLYRLGKQICCETIKKLLFIVWRYRGGNPNFFNPCFYFRQRTRKYSPFLTYLSWSSPYNLCRHIWRCFSVGYGNRRRRIQPVVGAFAKCSLFNRCIVIKTNAADRYVDDTRTVYATGVNGIYFRQYRCCKKVLFGFVSPIS